MIGSLMKRDPMVRPLARWTLAVVLFVLVSVSLQATHDAAGGSGELGGGLRVLRVLLLWLPAAMFMIIAAFSSRGNELDLAMPISGRTIWLAHLLSTVAVTVTILVTAALLDRLGQWLLYRAFPELHTEPVVLRLLPFAVACAMLTAVILQALGPGRFRSSLGFRRLGMVLGIVLAGGVAAWGLSHAPAWLALAPLAAAVGGVLYLHERVPPVLHLVDRAPTADGPAAAARGAAPRPVTAHERLPVAGGGRALLLRTVGESMLGRWVPWMLMPIVAVYGWLTSGAMHALDGGRDSRTIYIFLAAYLLLVTVLPSLRRLALVDALPIPRRLIFALTALPAILVYVLGYGVGSLSTAIFGGEREAILFSARDEASPPAVRVLLEYFEIAWDGDAPSIVAPWGETQEPMTIPVQEGLRPILYKPFSTPEGSSIDFVAYQISRAAQAIYGASISPEEIKNRYLRLDEAGHVAPRHPEGISLVRDHPHLQRQALAPVFPFMMAWVCGAYLLFLTVALRIQRRRVNESTRKAISWIALLVLLGLMLAMIAGDMAGVWDIHTHWSAIKILLHQVTHIGPLGAAVIWAGSAVVLAGTYLLAERQFMRLEASAKANLSAPWLLGCGE